MKGVYRYYQNGAITNITETWEINGSRTISQRDAPDYGVSIAVTGERDLHGHFSVFTVEWNGDYKALAVYTLDSAIRVQRTINGAQSSETIEKPAQLVVSPLMRVFMGTTIRQIIDCGGTASVLVPNITQPADADTLLRPLLETRHARALGDDCYEYIGERYDASARFWIDPHGILLRYTWQVWDVRLMYYER